MRGVHRRLLMVALLVTGAAGAQPAPPQPIEPSKLSDEFDSAQLDPSWSVFHERYGWPNKIRVMDVGKTTKGVLHLEPYDSAWVRDLNAPFLFKTIAGDFDVRTRVRMKGSDGDIPGGTWSLGGLMVRFPNGASATNWQPNRENWHFITTGVGHEAGKTMTETKGTYNSYSSLKLRPYRTGWVELRLVRVGMALFALARPDANSPWELRDRFYRMDMNPVTQVGLITYTSSPDVPEGPDNPEETNRTVNTTAKVDAVFEVDWIRGQRPKYAALEYWKVPRDQPAKFMEQWYAQVNGTNPLANPNLSEAEVLRLLGD